MYINFAYINDIFKYINTSKDRFRMIDQKVVKRKSKSAKFHYVRQNRLLSRGIKDTHACMFVKVILYKRKNQKARTANIEVRVGAERPIEPLVTEVVVSESKLNQSWALSVFFNFFINKK